MFSDVTSRAVLLFAPFVVCRLGKWKPRIRVLVGISTSRDFRLHLVRLAMVVNYGRNVSGFEKFEELFLTCNLTKKVSLNFIK